jgi:hypothetical protein
VDSRVSMCVRYPSLSLDHGSYKGMAGRKSRVGEWTYLDYMSHLHLRASASVASRKGIAILNLQKINGLELISQR